MNKAKRNAVIAGNWKMNKTPAEATALIGEIKAKLETVKNDECTVIACVPYVDIDAAVKAAAGSPIHIGAENCHWAKSGAFTGEISADMLVACGVEYVIIGHSERRQYFGETDETVNLRLKAALAAGIVPIVCVGELLGERDQGITEEVVSKQTKIAFLDVSADDAKKVIVAYEPVWAIGTGRTATADQADEVCGVIRNVLSEKYGKDVAEAVTIQYGGSMKPGNASDLLAKYHVDGGLIGGASLVAKDFADIIDAAQA